MTILTGCSRQEEPAAVPAATVAVPKKAPTQVVVPDSVKGKWKAVKIAVHDKADKRQEIFAVDIGSSLMIPDSDLSLKVENFLPAFQMTGTTLTSVSNETSNPAAQIVISEKGQEIFRGWLFSLYPNTHAFQHPRFSFNLVDFIPAGQKGG